MIICCVTNVLLLIPGYKTEEFSFIYNLLLHPSIFAGYILSIRLTAQGLLLLACQDVAKYRVFYGATAI